MAGWEGGRIGCYPHLAVLSPLRLCGRPLLFDSAQDAAGRHPQLRKAWCRFPRCCFVFTQSDPE
jgi:hypothetical protein